MTKISKCDAEVCYGAAGNRCPRVSCEFCSLSLHTKCANITNAIHKLLRESPGICWLCVKCRNADSRKSTSSDTIGLILQRTTSSMKLIGALVDSMKQFCRMYSESCGRPSCPAPPLSALADDINRTIGEVFNDPVDFSSLFESLVGDKRQRTSSVTGSPPPPEKLTKVDVPIPTVPTTATTVLLLSDDSHMSDDAHIADGSILTTTPAATGRPSSCATGITATSPSVSTATLLAEAPERAAALAVEQVNIRATKHAVEQATTHAAELAAAQAAVHAAEHAANQAVRQASEHIAAQAATHANELAAAQYATRVAEQVAAHVTEQAAAFAAKQAAASSAPPTAALPANWAAVCTGEQTSAALPSTATAPVNVVAPVIEHAAIRSILPTGVPVSQPMDLAVADDVYSAAPPTLSIAPTNDQRKWFYITRFLPCETTENIIRYIQSRTNCDVSLILCHKLARQGNSKARTLSFVSFKVSFPETLVPVITSDDFWPAGVSIKAFLDERPKSIHTRSSSRARLRPPPRGSNKPLNAKINSVHPLVQPALPIPVSQAPVLPPYLPHLHQLSLYPHYQLLQQQLHQMGAPRA